MDEVHNILMALGTADTKKVEVASYQLKDVVQTWCKMLLDSRALSGVSVTWESFKTTFLEKFFPKEIRVVKV